MPRSASDHLPFLRRPPVETFSERLAYGNGEHGLSGDFRSVYVFPEIVKPLPFPEIRRVVVERQGELLVDIAFIVVEALHPVAVLMRHNIAYQLNSRVVLLPVSLPLRLDDRSRKFEILGRQDYLHAGVREFVESYLPLFIPYRLDHEGVGARAVRHEEFSVVIGDASGSRVLEIYGDILHRLASGFVYDHPGRRTGLCGGKAAGYRRRQGKSKYLFHKVAKTREDSNNLRFFSAFTGSHR